MKTILPNRLSSSIKTIQCLQTQRTQPIPDVGIRSNDEILAFVLCGSAFQAFHLINAWEKITVFHLLIVLFRSQSERLIGNIQASKEF